MRAATDETQQFNWLRAQRAHAENNKLYYIIVNSDGAFFVLLRAQYAHAGKKNAHAYIGVNNDGAFVVVAPRAARAC